MHRRVPSTPVLLAIIALLIGGGVFVWYQIAAIPEAPAPVVVEEREPEASTVVTREIGRSVENRPISVVEFGEGARHLLFVGGIHGGYEWNSVLLAYEMIDHLTANPSVVPVDTRIAIIPVLNPDGLHDVIGTGGRFTLRDVPADVGPPPTGRFNANDVDLNRNFDCKWQPESSWRSQPVSAGTAPFSEPEAAALRDYVQATTPDAVVFWHSKANAVYASECEDGILPETRTLMDTYATAGMYTSIDSFDHYEVTGDAEGWLASIGIPAITVELETRDSIEWDRNYAAFTAVLSTFAK